MQVVSGRLTERSRLIRQNNDLTRSPHGHCMCVYMCTKKKYVWQSLFSVTDVMHVWERKSCGCVCIDICDYMTRRYLWLCVTDQFMFVYLWVWHQHHQPPSSPKILTTTWPFVGHGAPHLLQSKRWIPLVAVTTAWPVVTPIRTATDGTGSWD